MPFLTRGVLSPARGKPERVRASENTGGSTTYLPDLRCRAVPVPLGARGWISLLTGSSRHLEQRTTNAAVTRRTFYQRALLALSLNTPRILISRCAIDAASATPLPNCQATATFGFQCERTPAIAAGLWCGCRDAQASRLFENLLVSTWR